MAAEPRIRRLQSLFDAALELPAGERERFVGWVCADDAALRRELLAMLDHADRANLLGDDDHQAALAIAAQALPGTSLHRIGAYTLHEVLGDGGMGRVWRATRSAEGIEQEVAIKVVRGGTLNERLAHRLTVERRLLAELKHPGICRFLDAGTLDDGMPYVVMECVRGKPLLAHCREERLGIHARMRLLRQVCAAVAYAHGHLVIHRDIKPGNVLVDAHGQAKLLDFGIAKSLHSGADPTRTADRFLSPQSAAPEQFRGDVVGIGCDVYALGVLAYELLSGHLPLDFAGCNAAEIERRLLGVPPLPMSQRLSDADRAFAAECGCDLRTLRARLRGDMDAIVARCLRKEPSERYASVAQLDEDLGKVLAGEPISIRAGDGWYRARKFLARHRLGVGLGALLAATLMASSVLIARQSLEAERQRAQAVSERNVAREVVEVLKDAFGAADPSGVMGADVRARDILAAARPRIESLRETQPAAFAELALVLAEVEFDAGLDAGAAELGERALQAALDLHWADAELRPLWMQKLRADTHLDRPEGARTALTQVERIDGGGFRADRVLAEARLLVRQGDLARATEVLQAAAPRTAALAVDDDAALGLRLELANVLRRQGQSAHSLASYDQTLEWLRRSLPDSHGKVLRTRMRRLYVLLEGPDKAATAQEAEVVASGLTKTYGAGSPMAAVGGALLAFALRAAGRETEAIGHFEAALDTWETRLGPAHPETVRARYNLAEALGAASGPLDARAERLYREALAGAESAFGSVSNPTLFMTLGFARRLHQAGRIGEALDLLLADATLQGAAAARPENRASHQDGLRKALASPWCTATADPRCTLARTRLAAAASAEPTSP